MIMRQICEASQSAPGRRAPPGEVERDVAARYLGVTCAAILKQDKDLSTSLIKALDLFSCLTGRVAHIGVGH